jgi:DNA-binding LytR/AlgR family response regulator
LNRARGRRQTGGRIDSTWGGDSGRHKSRGSGWRVVTHFPGDGDPMRALKAVIAEDEPVLRAELRDTLARIWPELVICAEAEDGIEALRALTEHAPDILFLDIQMPGMSGLEVAKQASGKCHVAFVTAYDKYAVAAFEQGAVDYVMKPFSPARIASTVARLKEKVASAPANLNGLLKALADVAKGAKEYLRWITASQGDDLRLITVEEICYFQADNKYTLVVMPQQESLIRRPIKELIDELDPQMFWQIHRGTLVNVNAIAGVTRDIGGHLRVKLKERRETLSVSEPYMHLFKQM